MQVNHPRHHIPRQRRGNPEPRAAYAAQLAARIARLLPDLDNGERLELLGAMDESDLRASLAWLVSFAPHMFDCALVRDSRLLGQLRDRLGEADDDDLEPYCSHCGAQIGIFIGHGDGWHHFRGSGTVASPVELFDAGHEPAVSWAPAGAQ